MTGACTESCAPVSCVLCCRALQLVRHTCVLRAGCVVSQPAAHVLQSPDTPFPPQRHAVMRRAAVVCLRRIRVRLKLVAVGLARLSTYFAHPNRIPWPTLPVVVRPVDGLPFSSFTAFPARGPGLTGSHSPVDRSTVRTPLSGLPPPHTHTTRTGPETEHSDQAAPSAFPKGWAVFSILAM